MRVLLIQNPTAGYHSPDRAALVKSLESAGHVVTYRESNQDWNSLLDHADQDVVAVAGGDGTVASVAKALSGNPLPMTIFPAGTANNIAASLGIKGTAAELIGKLATFQKRAFDLGACRGAWGTWPFVESVGLGVLVKLMMHFEQKKEDGPEFESREHELRHAREELLTALKHVAPFSRRVLVDEKDCSGNYLLIEVLNVRRIGPELRLAPYADMNDGLLEVVLLREEDRQMLHDQLSEPHKTLDPTWPILQGRRVTIDICDQIHIDDKRWPEDGQTPPDQSVEITLAPGAVHVLAPPA